MYMTHSDIHVHVHSSYPGCKHSMYLPTTVPTFLLIELIIISQLTIFYNIMHLISSYNKGFCVGHIVNEESFKIKLPLECHSYFPKSI